MCADPLATRFLERHCEMSIIEAKSVADVAVLVDQEHPRAFMIMPRSPAETALGIDAARTILDQIAPLDLPVVICRVPTERRASHLLGVPEVLIKPVLHRDLIDAVHRVTAHVQRILAVDDDPDMLYLLRRIMASQWPDAEILTAGSGKEALAHVERRPDVIILDLLMPEMSQEPFQAFQKLHRPDRLVQVGIGSQTGCQFGLVQHRTDRNGHVARARVHLDALQQLPTVHIAHHDVK